MIELPLAALGGLLGSAHCVGMCGGFALTLGAHAPSWRQNVVRQSVFGLGRIFSYAFLGAAAGFAGRRLTAAAPLVDAQAWLAIVAGTLLLWQGAKATGLLRLPRRRAAASLPCLNLGLLGSLLRTRGLTAPLVAGVLTGLLPCGLVYGFVALAAGGASLGGGLAIMIAFGCGTLPLMTLLGLGTSLVGLAARRRLLHAAAWCVLVTGAVSVARGGTALYGARSAPEQTPSCPLCAERQAR